MLRLDYYKIVNRVRKCLLNIVYESYPSSVPPKIATQKSPVFLPHFPLISLAIRLDLVVFNWDLVDFYSKLPNLGPGTGHVSESC